MGKDGLGGGDGPEVPLLKNTHFHGNCPGCRLDRRKETRRGVPYTEFTCMWLVIVCSTLPIQSLFPFLYFMIRDLDIAKQVEDIGFYAGFIGASYMIGRALTSTVWGIVADKHGRKPVFVVTLIAVIILNTLFGLSSSYWMALTTRCLLGLFSGMLGPIKAYATEVCQKEYSHLSLSLVSSSRAIGLIVGPAIGGYLAQPADKYPSIFSQQSIFGRFPYFLPCLSISLLAIVALISCIWLPVSTITVCNILMNDSVSQDLRASANGLSVTLMSIFKAIAPAVAGIIFSWAQRRQTASFLPGDHLVFFMLNAATIVALMCTFGPHFAGNIKKH